MSDTNQAQLTHDDIIEAWGDYYLDNGQNMENLHQLPFEQSDTQDAGVVKPTDQTVLREAEVETAELLQPYQEGFTSKGDVTIVPVMMFLQHIKIDIGVTPHRYKGTWLDFLSKNNIDPETMPFIQWLVQNYLIGGAKEDYELKSVYKGKHVVPTEGTAGAAADVVNGLEEILNELVAAGKIEPFELGDLDTLSASAFVTKIEDHFVKAIPEKYRYNYQLELSMSRTYRDKFRQGMREKYNVNYLQTEQLLRVMDFENVTVVGRASMAGRKRIWTTPKTNLWFPAKGFENKSVFDVQKQDRKVKFMTDWWQGVGIIQGAITWMSSAEVPDTESGS